MNPVPAVTNAFSIDLSDWFCLSSLRGVIDPRDWHKQQPRIYHTTLRLLDLLDDFDAHATFFVLGWIADAYPDLVREIDARGHEIASHSQEHRLVHELTPREFEHDLARSLDTLRSLVDQPVVGYRAPGFSITPDCFWAFTIMARHGIEYDSSVFPAGGHPDYGIEDAPIDLFTAPSGVIEFPLSCVDLGGWRMPVGGGEFFRLYPYALTRGLMRAQNKRGLPVNFHLHPQDLDPGQPRLLPGSRARRFRQYHNLERTEPRLERLLGDFEFGTVRCVLDLQMGQDPHVVTSGRGAAAA